MTGSARQRPGPHIERLVMPHQTLPRTTIASRRATPSRSSRRALDQTSTDAGSSLFLGGVLVVALLAVLIWVGLF